MRLEGGGHNMQSGIIKPKFTIVIGKILGY